VITITYSLPGNFESTTYSSTFFAQVFNFGPDHSARVTKYQNCWDFYDGKHWTQTSPEGFDQVTINYCKIFVKKMRRFAFRNGWSSVFTEEQVADGINTWVNSVWKVNSAQKITNSVADFGGIFGDWFIYPQWLPSEDDDTEKSVGKPSDVKLVALDPRYVFPQYNAKTGEMEFCIILVPYQEFKLVGNQFELENRIYREIHTKEKIFIQELDEKNNVIEDKVINNPLGKLLIVHGIHQPQAGSYFGAGIVEDVIDGNKLFNEKASDISDILDYHAAPITLIFGAKARQLEKGANKIWSGLPASARIENLSSQGNIPAARDFLKDVKTWMHELSGIPEKSLGGERKISNTSATSLAIDFEPIIELADDVRFYFDEGIKKVNELIIDIGIYTEAINSSLEGAALYESSIDHGALLPRDRSLDLNDITTELNEGLESRKGAMERLGVRNVGAKVIEIQNEEEEDKKREMEMLEKYPPPEMFEPVSNVETESAIKKPDTFAKDEGTTPKKRKARKAINSNPDVHGQQVTNNEITKKS
jgi:hypothetical protein